MFYPYIRVPNPLSATNAVESFVPCGAVAGMYTRVDATRGVWKAAAGADASLNVSAITRTLSTSENGSLNVRGINCIRLFPEGRILVWGARTMDGADASSSDWKYVPVRRLATYVEESVDRGLSWVASQPNTLPLWTEVRASVEAFLMTLWRQGALAGSTPKEAFFVRCDTTTMTQTDIDARILKVLIGIAPVRRSEFILLRIERATG
jgi:phage tail sheath protein FI